MGIVSVGSLGMSLVGPRRTFLDMCADVCESLACLVSKKVKVLPKFKNEVSKTCPLFAHSTNTNQETTAKDQRWVVPWAFFMCQAGKAIEMHTCWRLESDTSKTWKSRYGDDKSFDIVKGFMHIRTAQDWPSIVWTGAGTDYSPRVIIIWTNPGSCLHGD